MGFKNILSLLVIASIFCVRGEEGGEEGKGEDNQEMDWGQMLQMGMEFGKQILGEEVVEKLKQGDLSTLMEVSQKVMKQDMVKDFLKSATDAMNTKNMEEDKLSERPSEDSISEGEDTLEGEEETPESKNEEDDEEPEPSNEGVEDEESEEELDTSDPGSKLGDEL